MWRGLPWWGRWARKLPGRARVEFLFCNRFLCKAAQQNSGWATTHAWRGGWLIPRQVYSSDIIPPTFRATGTFEIVQDSGRCDKTGTLCLFFSFRKAAVVLIWVREVISNWITYYVSWACLAFIINSFCHSWDRTIKITVFQRKLPYIIKDIITVSYEKNIRYQWFILFFKQQV